MDREHAFGEADVRLLTTLAGSMSMALEGAIVYWLERKARGQPAS